MSAIPLIVLDTGVLVEYIDLEGNFHSEATAVVESILSGKAIAIVPNVVFAEFFYVATRLYERLDKSKMKRKEEDAEIPEVRAEKLVRWLFNSPNVLMPENSLELALVVGRIKKRFSLALPDSFVLACAQLNKCKAVFKSVEEEMERGKKLELLKEQAEFGLVFLEDYH